MAASPPRPPLGTITTNRTSVGSPKRHTVPPPTAVAPAASASSAANPYQQHVVTSYSPPSPVKRLMTKVSNFRWNVPELRPTQCYSLSFIFHNKASGGTALLVDRTGGGKSHTMRCSGVFTRGIVVIIVPLLALAADVFLKFVTDDATFGSVDAIHFDEDIGDDRPLRHQLINDLKDIPADTQRTVFLFISPQRLDKYKDLRSCLLSRHNVGLLRNVMIDEFHLFCQHGLDFRQEIRRICNSFIRILMARKKPPYLLLCTATCSLHNIETFRRMTGVHLTKRHQIWSTPRDFQQRNIRMTFEITNQYKQSTCKHILDFLASNDSSSFMVYAGTASLAKSMYNALRDAMNSAGVPVDVLLVHGSQSSLEKFLYTRAFTSTSSEMDDNGVNLRGFIGTSAIDAGLDHPDLVSVYILQTPRDMPSYVQRRGRVGRGGEASLCHLALNFDDFMFVAIQILKDDHVQPHNAHLPANERSFVTRVKFDEFMTFVRFMSLNHGCWHCKVESFCATGYLPNIPIPLNSRHFTKCGTLCPECTGTIKNYFRPFYITGLIHFFDSHLASRSFPMKFERTFPKNSG